MAKTKQDYFNEGRDTARAFIVAGNIDLYQNGYPLLGLQGNSLNVSMSGSWQAVAWRAGFDDARLGAATIAAARDSHAILQIESAAATPAFSDTEHKGDPKMHAVGSHISALLNDARACKDDKRARRLHVKAHKLTVRHGLAILR